LGHCREGFWRGRRPAGVLDTTLVPRMLRSAPHFTAWCTADPGPMFRGPCSDGSRPCGAARRALHRVRDTIASAGRMREAIDGRHEKSAGMPCSAKIMAGDRCAWRKNSALVSVCFYQSSPLCKNISLPPSGKSSLQVRAIPPHQRGVSRSSRTRGADAVDAAAFCVRRDGRVDREICERSPAR
jgi:hypothetical protein